MTDEARLTYLLKRLHEIQQKPASSLTAADALLIAEGVKYKTELEALEQKLAKFKNRPEVTITDAEWDLT